MLKKRERDETDGIYRRPVEVCLKKSLRNSMETEKKLCKPSFLCKSLKEHKEIILIFSFPQSYQRARMSAGLIPSWFSIFFFFKKLCSPSFASQGKEIILREMIKNIYFARLRSNSLTSTINTLLDELISF